MKFLNSNIPRHLFTLKKEDSDLERLIEKIPDELRSALKNTGLTNLYLLPFHPNQEVRKLFLGENKQHIKTIQKVKRYNLQATQNFLLEKILQKCGIETQPITNSNKSIELMHFEDKNELQKRIAELFAENPSSLVKFERNYNPNSNLLPSVFEKYAQLVNKKTKGEIINVDFGIVKNKRRKNIVYFQSREKTNDSLKYSLAYSIFSLIKKAKTTNPDYQKLIKKKETGSEGLSNSKILASSENERLENYFQSFFIDDFHAFEIVTSEFIPPNKGPEDNSTINKIEKRIQQNPSIKILEFKDMFFNPKRPRAKQYVLSIPESVFEQVLPFPDLLSDNYYEDLRVSFHVKPFRDALNYHFGEKAHNLYKERKKPRFVLNELKKREEKALYKSVLETLDFFI